MLCGAQSRMARDLAKSFFATFPSKGPFFGKKNWQQKYFGKKILDIEIGQKNFWKKNWGKKKFWQKKFGKKNLGKKNFGYKNWAKKFLEKKILEKKF